MTAPDPVVPVPGVIPAPHFLGWRKWNPSGSGDMYGNEKGAHDAAVAMPVQAIFQVGTQQPVNAEYDKRQVYEVDVLVPDSSMYGKRDIILLWGARNEDGTYTGGRAFVFDGHPEDYRTGSPFPELNGVFGDQMRLKRTG